MDIKFTKLCGLSTLCACSILTLNSYADIIGDDAFLIAENVIAGIGKDGAFGSVNALPVSVLPVDDIGGNKIGYISDPTKQGFAGGFDGDFFLPYSPEEGWGVRINNTNYNNNRNLETTGIQGELSNFLTKPRFSSVDWNGVVNSLEIKKTFRTYNKGLSIIIDVELKNASNATMNEVYFMRTVNPDNNHSNPVNPTGQFGTKNTILKQGDVNSLSSVSAGQADGSLVTLSGYSENSRVVIGIPADGNGSYPIRNALNVYNGLGGLMNQGSNDANSAIAVAFKFETLLPGETVKFTHSYGLADLPVPNVTLDLDDSSGLAGGAFKQLYMLGTAGVSITDTDAAITGTASQLLQGLRVKLTNPSSGDTLAIVGAMPAGIVIDADEVNNETEINLKGAALVSDYMTVLKSIVFENSSIDASLTTREVVVQVLDETFILSNSNIANIFITVPLEIDSNIAVDNILSKLEQDADLTISGTAAPNSNLELILTDKNLKTVTKNFTVNPNGTWTTDIPKGDLLTLAEGPIKVDAKSTDQFGNITTDDAEFIKDTEVLLKVTSPVDGAVITDKEVVIEGDTDPEAEVKVTTSDGKECTTTADIEGKWSCTLTGLEKGQTYPLTIMATDKVGNEGTLPLDEAITIEVNSIDLTVQSPAFEAEAEDSTPVITGKTEPDFDVEVITTQSGDVCITKADSAGNWSCELAIIPTGGPHDLTVVAKDPDTDKEAVLPWRVAIPAITLEVTEPTLNAIADDNTPEVKGITDPNMEVTVTTEFGDECITTADANGNWSCELDAMPAGGPHGLTIKAKDPRTGSESTKPWGVAIPAVTLDVTEPAFNEIVDDETPLITGKTDPGAEITVEYAPDKECKVVADTLGNWSCELDKMPSGGPYDLNIVAKDPKTGSVSNLPWRVGVQDLMLDVTSPQLGDVVTNSPTKVEGKTNPNAEVTVEGPNGQICTTTADATGAWECPLEGVLTGDNQEFSVTARTPGGIERKETLQLNIAIDDGTVTTALKGGSGSFGSGILLLLFSLLFTRRSMKKKKNSSGL